eukprot:UN08962
MFLDNENFNIARKAFAFTAKTHDGKIGPEDLQIFFEGVSLNLTEESSCTIYSAARHQRRWIPRRNRIYSIVT